MTCKQLKEDLGIDENCIAHKLTAEENGKKFTIQIPKKSKEKFCRIKVDDCFIKNEKVEKCDYAFHRCSNEDQYYVELKGLKIKKAYSQILKTISTHLPSPKEKNYGFIVASRVPKAGTDINKLKEDFIKNHGVKLVIGTKQIIHRI